MKTDGFPQEWCDKAKQLFWGFRPPSQCKENHSQHRLVNYAIKVILHSDLWSQCAKKFAAVMNYVEWVGTKKTWLIMCTG